MGRRNPSTLGCLVRLNQVGAPERAPYAQTSSTSTRASLITLAAWANSAAATLQRGAGGRKRTSGPCRVPRAESSVPYAAGLSRACPALPATSPAWHNDRVVLQPRCLQPPQRGAPVGSRQNSPWRVRVICVQSCLRWLGFGMAHLWLREGISSAGFALRISANFGSGLSALV